MKRTRYTQSQIIDKLRLAEQLAAEGKTGAAIAKQLEVSEQTYYRWKRTYGGSDKTHIHRLRELERENQKLKRIVADKELDLLMLRDVLSKKF
jgi:putative transposase